nr:hypothetical protein [Tanacetum cinerariifolium]
SCTSSQGYPSVSCRTHQESQELITEKDKEEEEEPKLTWYLASKPNHLKFLVLVVGVLESYYICDEFIEDYNILLVKGCAVKEEKIIPAESKVQLPSEYDFKPVGVYRSFDKEYGVVLYDTILLKLLYTSVGLKSYSDGYRTLASTDILGILVSAGGCDCETKDFTIGVLLTSELVRVKVRVTHLNSRRPQTYGTKGFSKDVCKELRFVADLGRAGANNDINVLDNSPSFEDLLDDIAHVALFVVAGANNDINVLDNSSSFEDLLDDIAHVALFVVNGVGFKNGYYLADRIYPYPVIFTRILLETACNILRERNIRSSASHCIHNGTTAEA